MENSAHPLVYIFCEIPHCKRPNHHPKCAAGAQHENTKPCLLGSPQPGVLPGKGDGLKGSSDPGEFAVTVAEFHRLMLGKRDGNRPSYTRVRLQRADLKHL